MTDVEIAEHALAVLHDKLLAATRRANEIAIDRQRLGYLVFVDNDPAARVELDKLNVELAGLATAVEDIKAAIVEADKRLVAAQAAVSRADAQERRLRSLAILTELEPLGPLLNVTRPHPDDGNPYSPSDPPLVIRTATLTAALLVELRALGLGRDASFPAFWHGAAGKADLAKTLRTTIHKGWPAVAGLIHQAEPSSIRFGERRSLDFVKILSVWGKAVRADLARQEQMEAANAA